MRFPVSIRHCLSFIIFAAICTPLGAQTATKAFDFPGTHNGKAAQGMAIHGNTAFLLNDEGWCRIYNLATRQLLTQFALASAEPSNHANCAGFGPEYPKGNDMFPALYVSECWDPCRCFVESVSTKGPRIMQTLQLKVNGKARGANWYVDRERKFLYTIFGASGVIDARGTKKYRITKLPLPPIPPAGKSKIVFTEKDIVDKFEVAFHNLVQGGTIHNGFLYLPVGASAASPPAQYKDRAVIIIDLNAKKIARVIDLNASVPEEPEDVAFYGDTLLLYVGQKGGLYKIPLPPVVETSGAQGAQ